MSLVSWYFVVCLIHYFYVPVMIKEFMILCGSKLLILFQHCTIKVKTVWYITGPLHFAKKKNCGILTGQCILFVFLDVYFKYFAWMIARVVSLATLIHFLLQKFSFCDFACIWVNALVKYFELKEIVGREVEVMHDVNLHHTHHSNFNFFLLIFDKN